MLIVLTALALAGASPAQNGAAQAPTVQGDALQAPVPGAKPMAGNQQARDKLKAADTNKDGKWSRAEWLAAGRRDRGFTFMDSNRDGFLTPAELMAGMQKLRAMGFSGGN